MWRSVPGNCLKHWSRTDATTHTFLVVDVSDMPKCHLMALVMACLNVATVSESSSFGWRWLLISTHNIGCSIDADGEFSMHITYVATCSGWSASRRSFINCQCSSFSSSIFVSAGLTTFLSHIQAAELNELLADFTHWIPAHFTVLN